MDCALCCLLSALVNKIFLFFDLFASLFEFFFFLIHRATSCLCCVLGVLVCCSHQRVLEFLVDFIQFVQVAFEVIARNEHRQLVFSIFDHQVAVSRGLDWLLYRLTRPSLLTVNAYLFVLVVSSPVHEHQVRVVLDLSPQAFGVSFRRLFLFFVAHSLIVGGISLQGLTIDIHNVVAQLLVPVFLLLITIFQVYHANVVLSKLSHGSSIRK